LLHNLYKRALTAATKKTICSKMPKFRVKFPNGDPPTVTRTERMKTVTRFRTSGARNKTALVVENQFPSRFLTARRTFGRLGAAVVSGSRGRADLAVVDTGHWDGAAADRSGRLSVVTDHVTPPHSTLDALSTPLARISLVAGIDAPTRPPARQPMTTMRTFWRQNVYVYYTSFAVSFKRVECCWHSTK